VRSEPGSGTTFKIYLPRIERTIETGVGASSVAGNAHKSATVLLVENEEQLRSLARQILLRHGYTVLEARTGVEAVQHAEQEARPIDLLLTDIVMPEMHGRELAERVKRCHPEAKIVFMSGYTENTEAGHRVPGGEIPLLMKPFTPEGLIGKVREALSGRCSG
jgi:two-component system cell cycle sensor histidine kinase/response regulator CckA